MDEMHDKILDNKGYSCRRMESEWRYVKKVGNIFRQGQPGSTLGICQGIMNIRHLEIAKASIIFIE